MPWQDQFPPEVVVIIERLDAHSLWPEEKRQDKKLDHILRILKRMERTMAASQQELMGKLDDLEGKVVAYTTDRGEEIADAVAKAKAAWDADDEAEHAAAIAKIEEIGGKLVTFTPSGN